MALLDRLEISRMMWNLSNKDESSAMIASDCDKVSDLTDADLSQAGLWLKEMLGGANPVDPTAEAEGDSRESDVSGTSFATGQFACRVSMTNSWQDGDKTVFQYELSLTNNGSDVSSWEIAIPFGEPIEVVDGWNGNYEVDGSILRIRNADYNGQLAAGATLGELGFQVKGSASLTIAP